MNKDMMNEDLGSMRGGRGCVKRDSGRCEIQEV